MTHEATRYLDILDSFEQFILARTFRGEPVPHYPTDAPAALAPARRNAPPTSSIRGRRAAGVRL